MKNIKFLLLLIIALIGFNSCDQDDDLVFTAAEAEGFVFNTTFLDNYILGTGVNSNLAERFTWNNADFGVPTEITYDLQAAINEDFSDFVGDITASDYNTYNLGTTTSNELAVTVGQMLTLANLIEGIDNDPDTADIPNTSQLYFRLQATIGTENLESFSAIQTLNIELQEVTVVGTGGPNCDSVWVVGAGAVDAGWNWDSPIEFLCTDDVYKANINLTNDAFRFFTVEADWGTGQNYPFYANDGYTIDSRLEDAMDGDNNFFFNGTPGEYSLTVDTVNKTITLGGVELGSGNCDSVWVVGAGAVDAGWNWDSPIEFVCTDNVYRANINLINDAFRFFTVEADWGTGQNYPFYANDGYTIDSNFEDAMDGDNNFLFNGTPGYYLLTIDTVNKTITLGSPGQEEANCDSVWVVGAGAVDAGWNWDSPIEFTCTNGALSANINLTNDAFRFFTVEADWGTGQNYPFYADDGYTIDSRLEDALDGDNNFLFNGTPGSYYLRVDTVNKTITLQ